jgi:hypothetical protein
MTTTNKSLAEPSNGSLNWDTPLNTNFAIIDAALGSTTTIDVTGEGAAPVLLSAAQYQSLIIAFIGTLSADLTYQVPSGVGGQWIISNAASGAHTITFRTAAAGAEVVIPVSSGVTVYSDGTDVFFSSSAGSDTQIIYNSAGTVTGSSNLTFDGAAVSIGASTATTGASCVGTTATVTFSNGETIPVGSVVTIAGVTPTGYNGSWVTTGTATLDEVEFTVPSALGSQSVAGTIDYGNLKMGGTTVTASATSLSLLSNRSEVSSQNLDENRTAGVTNTGVNDGTKSSGTYTPTPVGGNMRYISNAGAFTLAVPTYAGDYTMVIQITNAAGAGAITLSGFSKTTGSPFTTTVGHDFFVYITKLNGFTLANTVALQ